MLRSQEELEQILEKDRQQAMEMLEAGKTSAKVLWSSVKQGTLGMGTAKFNEIKKWSAERDIEYKKGMLRKQLSLLSGVSLDNMTIEKEQELLQQYENDDVIKGWLSIIEQQKNFYDQAQNKIDSCMAYYNEMEKEQLKLIDNLDDSLLKTTLPFVADVVSGLTDYTNLVKQAGIGMAVALASPGIAAGAAAVGLGKVGTFVTTKGIEYGLNAIDNWFTMEQEHELINPDADPLTTKEKVYGMVVGTIVDGAFDSLWYGAKKGMNYLFKSSDKIVESVKRSIIPNDDVPLNNSSAKEVAKQVYDIEHGIGSANEDLFRLKIEENPNTPYNYALDPSNPHNDIFDNQMNFTLENSNEKYYYIDENGVKKYDVSASQISPNEDYYINNIEANFDGVSYKDIESDTIKYKLENDIPLDEPIQPVYKVKGSGDLSDNEVNIYKIGEFSNKEKISTNYVKTLKALQENDIGSYAHVVDGNNSIIMFKDKKDTVVRIIQDVEYTNRAVKDIPDIMNNNFVVRKIKGNTQARVEVIDINGNIKNISGMEKLNYIGKFTRLKQLNELSKSINIMAEAMSANKYQIDDDTFGVKGDVGRSIVDITDRLMSERQHTANNIVSYNEKEFKRLMVDPETNKPFFKDVDDMLHQTDKEALAELFVNGTTDKKIFLKKFENEDIVKKQLEIWVNGLIDNNTFIVGYKNKMNIEFDMNDPNIRDKYKQILKFDDDGNIVYNTDKGALFEGMNEDEIEYRILEMLSNPENIDLEYKNGIPDREVLYNIFKDITADRQNAMAINRVFKSNDVDTGILYDFGMIKDDGEGNTIVPINDFIIGLSNIIGEISNPDTKYDLDELKNIITLFTKKFDVLPKKYNVEQDGRIAVNLLDFVLNNKNNSISDIGELHDNILPFIQSLDDTLSNHTNKILPLIEESDVALQVDKIDKGNVDKLASILEKWKNKFSKENGANNYISTQQFKDELEQVKNLSNKINIDGEHITNATDLDNIKEATYTGNITFDNISDTLSPIIDMTNDSVKNDIIIRDKVDAIKNVIGRKRKIENIVSTDEFKIQMDSIVEDLRQQGITEDVIQKLYSNNHKELKSGIKDVEDFLYNHSKKRNTFLDNIDELEELKTPEDIEKYIKKTRNRKKIKYILDTMEEFGADKNIVNDIRDFVNYHGKEFDYKLDKNNIIGDIDNVLNSANDFKEKLDVENYGKKRNAYQQLYKRYTQIQNLIKDKTPQKSVQFLQSKDINVIYNDIEKYSKIVGKDVPDDIKYYKDILITLQDVLYDIQDSRKNSPLRNLNKEIAGGYGRTTSSLSQSVARINTVINKFRWFNDKEWYIQTPGKISNTNEYFEDVRVMDILFKDYKTIDDIPVGVAEKYINPKHFEIFKKFYEDAKYKFRGADILDDNGNIIGSEPLTIDQFAVVYAKFLDELSNTTRANKVKGLEALKVFFNNENDMKNFFTNRKTTYGVGYVKSNRNILKMYNQQNAMTFAEINTFGSDLRTFANKLNFNDKDVQQVLKNNKLSVSKDIEYNFKDGDGTYVKTETQDKRLNSSTQDIVTSISDYLKRARDQDFYYDGIRNVVSQSYDKYINLALDTIYPIVLNCTGLLESMFNPIFAFRRTSWTDARGKMFGYKSSNRLLGNAKMWSMNTLKGLGQGIVVAPNIVVNGILGGYNFYMTLDRYFLFQKAINSTFGTNIDLRIKNTNFNLTTKLLNNLNGGDAAILNAVLDNQMTKKTLKGVHDYIDPNKLKMKENIKEYSKTALSEAFDMFKDQAMNMQEIADTSRAILSSIRARDLMEEFLTKSYQDLPESIISTLRNFGITDVNYKDFVNTLKNISPDKKTFNGVYLMDLMGQIPDMENGVNPSSISSILREQNMDMLGAIQNITNYFYDNAFVLNKKLKYSSKTTDATKRLAFALRHTTMGIGLEDLSNIFHEKTASGLYQSKLSRFDRFADKKNIALNMFTNAATTIPFFLLSSVIVSKGGNILDDLFRKPERTKENLAQVATEWNIIKNRVIEDENFAKGLFKGLSYFSFKVLPKSISNAMPISSLFSPSNMLGTVKPFIGDVYLLTQKMINDPANADEEAINKTLHYFTKDLNYSSFESMRDGKLVPFINFAASIGGSRTFLKVPNAWRKAWIKSGDVYEQVKAREKFIKKDGTEEWELNAATTYDKMFLGSGLDESKILSPSNDKYNNLPDSTLVPIPDYDDLNDEGKEAVGEMLFDILNNVQEQSISSSYSAEINKMYTINEWAKSREIIDEDEYNDRKSKIYEDMNLKETINELPPQYKIAIKKIEKNIGYMDDIKKQDLYLNILQDISNGAEAYNLIDKYNPNNDNIEIKKDTIIPKRDYKTIDEVPITYKIYYKAMQKKGYKISEEDVLSLANQDAPIPKIPE